MTETAKIEIDAAPEAVWAVAGEFGGLDTWMAGVESCVVDGDVRTISTMGMTITERLVARDPDARSITYSIFGEGAPVTSHEATIRVGGSGEGSEVTWEVTIEPAEAEAMFRDIYQGALESLRAHVEG